jgi:hypothetical protein
MMEVVVLLLGGFVMARVFSASNLELEPPAHLRHEDPDRAELLGALQHLRG